MGKIREQVQALMNPAKKATRQEHEHALQQAQIEKKRLLRQIGNMKEHIREAPGTVQFTERTADENKLLRGDLKTDKRKPPTVADHAKKPEAPTTETDACMATRAAVLEDV